VKRTVPVVQEATMEQVLPARVQEALGELVGAAQEGLLALSVGVGLGVLHELMEEEVDEVVSPKGRHDPERSASRHGREDGAVTLGGRRVPVSRPRARSVGGGSEVALSTYAHFADRDPLSRVVLERMLAGVSTRRFARTQEPVGAEVEAGARSQSKSAVSRTFIERTREALGQLMGRRLDDVRLAVLMLDGIDLKGRTNVVCLGITTEGVKIPLGLWEGSTENSAVATALLSDLVARGLDTSQGLLAVLDGSKALRKAVSDVLGDVPVQRCQRHKERNVLDHLPDRDRDTVKRRLRMAWKLDDHDGAEQRLRALAGELETDPPRCRRVAARRARGDPHDHPARRHRRAPQDAREHEPDRVDDRVRPPLKPQRQALAERRDGAPLDGRGDARSRAAVPQGDRLQRPRKARRRDRTRPRPPDHHRHPDQGGPHTRYRLTITPGPPSRSSTTNGTSWLTVDALLRGLRAHENVLGLRTWSARGPGYATLPSLKVLSSGSSMSAREATVPHPAGVKGSRRR